MACGLGFALCQFYSLANRHVYSASEWVITYNESRPPNVYLEKRAIFLIQFLRNPFGESPLVIRFDSFSIKINPCLMKHSLLPKSISSRNFLRVLFKGSPSKQQLTVDIVTSKVHAMFAAREVTNYQISFKSRKNPRKRHR